MILGVHWAYQFPEGLYSFQYAKYRPDRGGHGSSPAELVVNGQVDKADLFVSELRALAHKHEYGRIWLYAEGNKVHLGLGGWCLLDYDLLLMQEVEKMLAHYQFVPTNDKVQGEQLIEHVGRRGEAWLSMPQKGVFEFGSYSFSKLSASCACLRFLCRLPLSHEIRFVQVLKSVLIAHNISVAFHRRREIDGTVHFQWYFSNGRQGLNLSPIIYVDAKLLEEQIIELMEGYEVKQGIDEAFYTFKPIEYEFILRNDMAFFR